MALRWFRRGQGARSAPSLRGPARPRPGRRAPPRSRARSRGRGRSAAVPGATEIAAREPLERALGELGGNPSPWSETSSSSAVPRATGPQLDLPRAVAQRVVDEVAERLAQAQLVGVQRLPVVGVDRDGAAALAGAVGEARRHPLEQLAELERLGPHGQLALAGARDAPAGPRPSARGDRTPRARRPAPSRTCGSWPPARSAPSSSALITATGVRSSWLASATKRRSRSNDRREAIEHLVERLPEAADLVVRRRQREPLGPAAERDVLRAPAHRLDRAQPGGGQRVAQQRREQDGHGTADRERRHEIGERVVAVLQRLADHRDRRAAAAARQHARRALDAGHAALDEDLLARRPPAAARPCSGRCAAGAARAGRARGRPAPAAARSPPPRSPDAPAVGELAASDGGGASGESGGRCSRRGRSSSGR